MQMTVITTTYKANVSWQMSYQIFSKN